MDTAKYATYDMIWCWILMIIICKLKHKILMCGTSGCGYIILFFSRYRFIFAAMCFLTYYSIIHASDLMILCLHHSSWLFRISIQFSCFFVLFFVFFVFFFFASFIMSYSCSIVGGFICWGMFFYCFPISQK